MNCIASNWDLYTFIQVQGETFAVFKEIELYFHAEYKDGGGMAQLPTGETEIVPFMELLSDHEKELLAGSVVE